MTKLILMRHGASQWNEKNLFTGWVDIPLSMKGIKESLEGGKKIASLPIDKIYTSSLVRSIETAMIAMAEHQSNKVPLILHTGEGKLEEWSEIYGEKAKELSIPVIRAWELNERMYGQLQGLDKDETRAKYGAEQVHIWRRSYDIAPPEGESLELTSQRTLPYFKNVIMPDIKDGKNVFICAHGNSLRSIVMFLDKLSEEEIVKLEIATGDPLIYTYENGRFIK